MKPEMFVCVWGRGGKCLHIFFSFLGGLFRKTKQKTFFQISVCACI